MFRNFLNLSKAEIYLNLFLVSPVLTRVLQRLLAGVASTQLKVATTSGKTAGFSLLFIYAVIFTIFMPILISTARL